ncbi:MAG: glycoside hydrolase family 97 N-terminal domain-containing protein [Chitinophagaceae bacterium]
MNFHNIKGLNHFVIAEENTEFALPNDFKAWWIPGDYKTQEYKYTTSPISKIPILFATAYEGNASQQLLPNSVQTPLMMYDSLQKIYVNIHEAASIDYPAINLEVDTHNYILKTHLTPGSKPKHKAFVQAPFHTPWRTIILSDKASDILASKLILNLNEPCKIPNIEFIKPMNYIGVWWQMFCPNGGTWHIAIPI